MKKRYFNYINNDVAFDKKIKLGILALIVVISGFFGFIYEFIFYYLNSGMKQFYYRGGNFLPWINIYAIGAIMIFWLTFKNRKMPLVVFLKSIIICGLLEFLAGFIMDKLFNFRCWSYNTEILNYGNINGYICLRSVLFFGLSSLLLIYFIVPFVFYLAKTINKRYFLIISLFLCSIVLFDEIYNLAVARLLSFPRASDIYKSFGIKYMHFKL